MLSVPRRGLLHRLFLVFLPLYPTCAALAADNSSPSLVQAVPVAREKRLPRVIFFMSCLFPLAFVFVIVSQSAARLSLTVTGFDWKAIATETLSSWRFEASSSKRPPLHLGLYD